MYKSLNQCITSIDYGEKGDCFGMVSNFKKECSTVGYEKTRHRNFLGLNLILILWTNRRKRRANRVKRTESASNVSYV